MFKIIQIIKFLFNYSNFCYTAQTRYMKRHCIQCISLTMVIRYSEPYHFHVTFTSYRTDFTLALLVVKIKIKKIFRLSPDLFRELFIDLNGSSSIKEYM